MTIRCWSRCAGTALAFCYRRHRRGRRAAAFVPSDAAQHFEKYPHHGSDSSTSARLLAQTSPGQPSSAAARPTNSVFPNRQCWSGWRPMGLISIEPIQQVACRQLFGPGPNLQYILLRGDNMALNYFIIGEEELLVRDAISEICSQHQSNGAWDRERVNS